MTKTNFKQYRNRETGEEAEIIKTIHQIKTRLKPRE